MFGYYSILCNIRIIICIRTERWKFAENSIRPSNYKLVWAHRTIVRLTGSFRRDRFTTDPTPPSVLATRPCFDISYPDGISPPPPTPSVYYWHQMHFALCRPIPCGRPCRPCYLRAKSLNGIRDVGKFNLYFESNNKPSRMKNDSERCGYR